MRAEKGLLVREAVTYLQDSDYFYLADFSRIHVEEVGELRKTLRTEGAAFHVVKNKILCLAVEVLTLPDLRKDLVGPTAVIAGGCNPSSVAKILLQFRKKHEDKLVIKCGFVTGHSLSPDEVKILSELPTLDELRARFMSLLQEPIRQMVCVLNAVPQGFLNVLQAKTS
ncbi:MAG: 50S ribosomal protein L10 [Puniceicoccales bacterium]|jgi:large subunit ribosomal protein L10|nr:50S ribosomal protein L10 [Puniceicoccales bacterium]